MRMKSQSIFPYGDGIFDGSSGNKNEKPKQLGEPSLFDKLKDWIDDNKDLLKTLCQAFHLVRCPRGRNRKNTDEKLKDLEDLQIVEGLI